MPCSAPYLLEASSPDDEQRQDGHSNYFILAGLDLKLFDLDLNLVDEYARKTKENSVKHAVVIKSDKFVVATNSDIEIYALVCLGGGGSSSAASTPATPDIDHADDDHNDHDRRRKAKKTTTAPATTTYIRIKELKKFVNSHEDSILCVEKLTDAMFASGSSSGHLILWQSDTLIRVFELRPFDELNQAHESKRLALTSVSNFQCLFDVGCFLIL